MKAAIDAVPYAASVKVGLQFKRRFWEEDEEIYGGISYTDLPIRQISYPSSGCNRSGKGVLLGAYLFEGAKPPNSPRWRRPSGSRARSNSARRSIRNTRPNSRTASRWPGTACRSHWAAPATGPTRRAQEHYDNLCQIDGRIVLAGEHASYIPAWQEGAILSALDAIARLHHRVVEDHEAVRTDPARSLRMTPLRGAAAAVARTPPHARSDSPAHAQPRLPVHRADRRGAVRQRLPGLPHARRQGAAAPASIRRSRSNGNLEAGGYPVYVVVNGPAAMPAFGP